MIKIYVLVMLFILSVSSAYAISNGPQNNEKAAGDGEKAQTMENVAAGQFGEGSVIRETNRSQIAVQERDEERARDGEQQDWNSLKLRLEEQEREREQEFEEKARNCTSDCEAVRNTNQVRLAVHAFLDLENVTGIGRNISLIARQFNNSIQATLNAEERIRNRSAFARFFTGGDEAAADEIAAEINRNADRTREVQRLIDSCNCTDEVRDMLRERLFVMEQEQDRLRNLSVQEKKSKGIFGWIWKRD